MIDPFKITDYERTDTELEEFALFCVAVAGKSSVQTAKGLEAFLTDLRAVYRNGGLWGREDTGLFALIHNAGNYDLLEPALRRSSLGQHNRLRSAFRGLAFLYDGPSLRTVGVGDLEKVHGIGFKTSRFFLLHSRPGVQHAVLDRHILRWLREECGHEKAPHQTPKTAHTYGAWEQVFRLEAARRDKTVAQLDLEVWSAYAKPAYEEEEENAPIL